MPLAFKHPCNSPHLPDSFTLVVVVVIAVIVVAVGAAVAVVVELVVFVDHDTSVTSTCDIL